MFLPDSIKRIIADKSYTLDSTGLSGSQVMIFDDMVLKIEPERESDQSLAVMRWLDGRVPAPRVLQCEIADGTRYLLMSRVHGEMSCSEYWLEHSDELVTLLADGLRMLWSVEISDCPYDRSLERELNDARQRIEHGEVDRSLDYGEFETPERLLEWLCANRPEEQFVFSHGDYCLPNVLLKDGAISGFIDLGDAGYADKWRDIEMCHTSLRNNFGGVFGGKVYENFDADILFDKLGIEKDEAKLRYYRLLGKLYG